jgi:hypothetical protein
VHRRGNGQIKVVGKYGGEGNGARLTIAFSHRSWLENLCRGTVISLRELRAVPRSRTSDASGLQERGLVSLPEQL